MDKFVPHHFPLSLGSGRAPSPPASYVFSMPESSPSYIQLPQQPAPTTAAASNYHHHSHSHPHHGQPRSAPYYNNNNPFPNPSPAPASLLFFNPAVAATAVASTSAVRGYKAPAHKHAHHLHSIPPREKSTRTLIIDHMLWVHGRTRFAQARAELGMTDRTGGPASPNYSHRHRPENYEEEEELGSEGEDVSCLKARSDTSSQLDDTDSEQRLSEQNLPLAQSLRLRAEGLEKVVTSMLDQTPPIHPVVEDDLIPQPGSSPELEPMAKGRHHADDIHKLPNGVRLRLALGTIINDFFARQSPRTPYRHTHQPGSKTSTPTSQTTIDSSGAGLPASLAHLSEVSGAKFLFPYGTPQAPSIAQIYPPRRMPPIPNQRTTSLYLTGAEPTAGNALPGYRCPRHLRTQCEICVEAKANSNTSRSSTGGGGNSNNSNSNGGNINSTATNGRFNSLAFNSTSSSRGTMPSAGWKGTPAGSGPSGAGVSGWQDGVGIGAGLSTPGARGCALRRKTRDWDAVLAGIDIHGHDGAGNTKLTSLIPRFLRLSALVAAELGREAKDEEQEMDVGAGPMGPNGSSGVPGPGGGGGGGISNGRQTSDLNGASIDGVTEVGNTQGLRIYDLAFRPTKEWYTLLSGLLTRAVLEGYLTAGWRGMQAMECLLTVGLGVEDVAAQALAQEEEEQEEIKYEQFDPDDLPGLTDTVKLLFPSLRESTPSRKGVAEEEYEAEMFERLRRFHDVRQLTPDLATHMEDLAWQYPAEPIERAALRFCEAIAKWRGKPELEKYKKKPTPTTPGLSSMSIESLVHSNPTSPTIMTGVQNPVPGPISFPIPAPRRLRHKPSLDIYFAPPPLVASPWGRTPGKRGRSLSAAQMQGPQAKKLQKS